MVMQIVTLIHNRLVIVIWSSDDTFGSLVCMFLRFVVCDCTFSMTMVVLRECM